jgi:predicted dehydrogenase
VTKLRVGVIGTGFGSEVQIPAFKANPRVELVAVASGTPGKARRIGDRFGIPQAFDDYKELVQRDLDLVSITTPPHLHHPMTMAVLAAGPHVLCEKPMALDVREAEDMLREAERREVVHVIDHELRFNPNRRKIRALIQDGAIGRPRHALITVIGPSRSDPTRPWTWWSDASKGGGILGALGSHQIDLLRFYLGEIEAAWGTTETYIKELPELQTGGRRKVTADDFSAFSMRFHSGAVGTVLLSGVAAHQQGPRIEIWGDAGTIVLDQQERLWTGKRGQDLDEVTDPEPLKPAPGMEYSRLSGLSFIRLVENLVGIILDGRPMEPAATFHDGLQVQRTMAAICESAQRGSWVALSDDGRSTT